MSDWGSVNEKSLSHAAAVQLEREVEVASKARRYMELMDKIDTMQEEADALKADLVAEFPEEMEDQTRLFANMAITVKRGERWTWDSDKLREIVGDVDSSHLVKMSLSIDKRKFQKLADEEKAPYLAALTRAPGPVKVEVSAL